MISASKMLLPDAAGKYREVTEKQEREFFSMLRQQKRINKTTWKGRLRDVDESVITFLHAHHSSPRQCLDVGVSAGLVTRDWYQALKKHGMTVGMVGTDLTFCAYLVSLGAGIRVLSTVNGEELQFDVLGWAIRPGRPRRRDWLTGAAIVSRLIQRRWERVRKSVLPSEGNGCQYGATKRQTNGITKEVLLVSPSARCSGEIKYVEDDIFMPPPDWMVGAFDIVRVANLLHRDYFSEEQIIEACKGVKRRLAGTGSLFVLCRTWEDSTNHCTFFRLNAEGKFAVAHRVGQGCEIEPLVLAA